MYEVKSLKYLKVLSEPARSEIRWVFKGSVKRHVNFGSCTKLKNKMFTETRLASSTDDIIFYIRHLWREAIRV